MIKYKKKRKMSGPKNLVLTWKTLKKKLKEQFSGVRDRRERRKGINKILRVFQDVESFMEIYMRRGNRRRY